MEQTKKQLRRDTKIKKKYLEYYEKHKRDAYDKTKPKVKKYGEWMKEHHPTKLTRRTQKVKKDIGSALTEAEKNRMLRRKK